VGRFVKSYKCQWLTLAFLNPSARVSQLVGYFEQQAWGTSTHILPSKCLNSVLKSAENVSSILLIFCVLLAEIKYPLNTPPVGWHFHCCSVNNRIYLSCEKDLCSVPSAGVWCPPSPSIPLSTMFLIAACSWHSGRKRISLIDDTAAQHPVCWRA